MYSCLSLTRQLSSRRWPATPGCGVHRPRQDRDPAGPAGAAAPAAGQDRTGLRARSALLRAPGQPVPRCPARRLCGAAPLSRRRGVPVPLRWPVLAQRRYCAPVPAGRAAGSSTPHRAVMAGPQAANEADRTARASSQPTPQPVTSRRSSIQESLRTPCAPAGLVPERRVGDREQGLARGAAIPWVRPLSSRPPCISIHRDLALECAHLPLRARLTGRSCREEGVQHRGDSRTRRPGFAIGDRRAGGGSQPFPGPWIFRLGTFGLNAIGPPVLAA
jgi:hypothetical protein